MSIETHYIALEITEKILLYLESKGVDGRAFINEIWEMIESILQDYD